MANHLFNYMGYIGCGIILGGIDVKGPQIWSVDPHGHTICLPYLTMGSGSLAADAILETYYREENGEICLTEQEAIEICAKAIEGGIYHDLGSGSNVDYVVINKNGHKLVRSYKSDNKKLFNHPEGYNFPAGTTPVMDLFKFPLDIEEGQAPMEL